MTEKPSLIYIQQYGGWWSLKPEKWLEICIKCATPEGYEFEWDDEAKPLKNRPGAIMVSSSEGGSYWSAWNKYWLRQPVDWDISDYADEVAELKKAGIMTKNGG